MSPRPLVLFDFDGVIADSFTTALHVAQMMCVHITEDSYLKSFEENVHDWWEREIEQAKHGPECKHDIDWFGEFVPLFEKQVIPFAGMESVIHELSKKYLLIVISSTITSPIQGFLEKYHLGRYFSEILGSDIHTKKTEKIQIVFDKYAVSAKDCVFITDSLGDMREATEKNVDAIGVTWGWHNREVLERGKPFRIVDTPKDITLAIDDYFAQNHVSP